MKLKAFMRRVLLKALDYLSRPENNTVQKPQNRASGVKGLSNEFYLDENSSFDISGTPVSITFPRWMQITHCIDKRPSLIIVAGERLMITDLSQIEKDTHLFVRYAAALPNISADGLVFEVLFSDDRKDSADVIATLTLPGGQQPPDWRVADLDLSFLTGRRGYFSARCQPGVEKDPSGDWLAIADLCIARQDRLPLLMARSFHGLRSRNEIEHFSEVYRQSMYSQIQDERAEIARGQARPVRTLPHRVDVDPMLHANPIEDLEPFLHESPYLYASRLLAAHIPQSPTDFAGRLRSKAENGESIKVLSLCSGAARIEADLASNVGANVEWSLLDINPDLLGLASKQFAPSLRLDLIEANANELAYSGEKWDIILCVSALHHVVELEKLVRFCHSSLNDGGEFWSIGECVGRDGNRLWPDARVEANIIFGELPEKYRLNSHTGEVDPEIPDNDYSVGCFEGIRSEDIEPILDRWFQPVDVYRRNCFMWRLLNNAYLDNYDILDPDDRHWIVRIVQAELDHFRDGGRGTELFGVYRPRRLIKI